MKRILLVVLTVSFHFGQAQNCPDGSSSFRNREYDKAFKAYKDCLKEHPGDSLLIFMSGYTLLRQQEYKKAIPLLEEAIAANYQPVTNAQYAISRAYAGAGNSQEASTYLNQAIEGGFNGYGRLDSVEFRILGDELSELKEKAYENAFPCLKDANNSKFDFWIGEWDVLVAGVKRAESSITKAKGGCAIHEDYVVLNGSYSGQSISFYDPTDDEWQQYWVGSGGDKSKFYESENYEDEGNLQFITKSTSNGAETWTKMTYIKVSEDEVHQNLDSSTDQGKTWTPGFRGVYIRKTK